MVSGYADLGELISLVSVRLALRFFCETSLTNALRLPYEGLYCPSRERAAEIGGALIAFQARGISMMLRIWDQKLEQVAANADATVTGLDSQWICRSDRNRN